MSDDGQHGITVIAFIGSVFSPYYAMARRRAPGGTAPAENHCAINVALYSNRRQGRRWSMTERGAQQLRRSADSICIGPSAWHWQGDTLTIELDEVSVPWPARIRGRLRVHAPVRFDHPVALAQAAGHTWHPVAPSARIEVDLQHPGLRWSGAAYLDANRGDGPLEQTFARWDWSRAHLAGAKSVVLYDVERRTEGPLEVALAFGADGSVHRIEPPAAFALPASRWGIARGTRGDMGSPVRLLQTLTDAPFYARSLLQTQLLGEPARAVHESLSLARFDTRWVQAMLPFRMPRRARGGALPRAL